MSAPPSSSSGSVPSSAPLFRPSYANVLGATVLDDNVRLLCDFLYQHALLPDVEIEGKLGLLYDRRKQSRFQIDGCKSLVCVAPDELPDAQLNFCAEVDANMFGHINDGLLQRRVHDDAAKARAHNAKSHWRYAPVLLLDKFYPVNGEHVRVTTDQQGTVKECIVKEKLQHIEFWSGKPKSIDFRVSASRERTVPLPTCEPDQIRRKDRRTYRFDLWSLELTRVDLFTGSSLTKGELRPDARPASSTFEVEVELKETECLRREAAKVRAGQPNDFVKIASALLDTMRTLAQFAFPGQLPPNLKQQAAAAAAAAQQQQQQQQQHSAMPNASASGSAAGAPAPAAPAAAAAAVAAAGASKKRPRTDEPQTEAKQDEFGKAWS